MVDRSATAAVVVAVAAAWAMISGAQAADESKYPNWKGQWLTINPRLGGQVIKFDPTKPWGPAQQAPLTPEYQKVLEEFRESQYSKLSKRRIAELTAVNAAPPAASANTVTATPTAAPPPEK